MEKKKILVIDDENEVLMLFEKRLTEAGYQVFKEQDGGNALEKIVEVVPDLILLDISMPGVDGFSILKKIKEELNLRVSIAMLTSSNYINDVAKSYADGACSYIVKSLNSKEFLAAIEKIFKKIEKQQE